MKRLTAFVVTVCAVPLAASAWVAPPTGMAQSSATEADVGVGVDSPPTPHELPSKVNHPPVIRERQTSPPLPPEMLRVGPFQSVQVNVDEFGNNILGDAANEPSIAVDPNNWTRMAIGWRQFDDPSGHVVEAGVGYSRDGGQSWTTGKINPGAIRDYPVLESDANGRFFYNSVLREGIPGTIRCAQLFRSENGGKDWPSSTFVGEGARSWIGIDKTDGIGRGNIYTHWQSGTSNCFDWPFTNGSRSVNNGLDFGALNLGAPSFPLNFFYNGTIAVAADGDAFIVGSNSSATAQILLRSLDAQDPAVSAPFWERIILPSFGVAPIAYPNDPGLASRLWIDTDRSTGPFSGNIYILTSALGTGTGDPGDVFFTRSLDGGDTWSAVTRVNSDPLSNAVQWFGMMSVAPNGRIDVAWNDTRTELNEPFPGNHAFSELYYTYSVDGGQTWAQEVPVTPPFNHLAGRPTNRPSLGEHYDMESDDAGVHIAYAATFNGEQDIYYLRIGMRDCNENGISDDVDIASLSSSDVNNNGIPDECETLLGDLNCDGAITVSDIGPFITALVNPAQYAIDYPNCDINNADMNMDTAVTVSDIGLFIEAVVGG